MVKAKTPSKTPMKAQDTPKSIKKRKAEQIETPAKTPKSIKENVEMVTPKSTKKMKAEKTPQVQQKQQTPQVPKSEKKNKNSLLNSSLEKSPKKDSKDERMEVSVQFPRLKCYKSALLQMLDTDKPILLSEPIVFSLQYSDRNSAVDAVKKLETLSNSAVKVTAKLSGNKQGEAVKTKRIVYVPKKAANDEAVSVLTKAYGASKVEPKSFFNETKLMVLTFASEEAANAADKVKDKLYHGIELVMGSFFPPNKRELDEKQEGQDAKKMKKEKDAPAKKESDDDEEEDDDDDDDDDDSDSDDMEVDVKKMRKEVAATKPDEEEEEDDEGDDDEEDDDDDDDDEE